MELQFNQSVIEFLTDAVSQVRTAELTQEIKLPEGMPDIGRVLTSWGQIVIRSKEWNRDEIAVSGGVMVWVLYLPEDGTEVRSIENWLPFQMKWDVDASVREGTIRILPLIRFVDSRGVSARKIMTRAGISALLQAVTSGDAQLYSPCNLPEDVQLLQNTYAVRVPKEAGERTFLLDEELEMTESAPKVERILSVCLRPEITDKKVIGSKTVFKGNGNLHMVYRCPEGKIRTADWDLPFSQFAQLDGAYSPDSRVDIWTAVTSLESDLGESGLVRVKAGLVGQYLVDETEQLELTEDSYSPFREVQVNRGTLELPAILEDRRETVRMEQTVPGQTGTEADVNFLPDFPALRHTGAGGELELSGLFQVLYYGEDGTLQSANVRQESGLDFPLGENTVLQTLPSGDGNPEFSAGLDGIGLSQILSLQLRSVANTNLPMVTGIQAGDLEEPDESRPALVLCRAGTEELWSIAKRCGSTVNAIKEANGIEVLPNDGRMLVIPVS